MKKVKFIKRVGLWSAGMVVSLADGVAASVLASGAATEDFTSTGSVTTLSIGFERLSAADSGDIVTTEIKEVVKKKGKKNNG